MNITDLRSALRERADDVDRHDAAERVTRVHDRVRRVRRQRIAGVAALTVAALVIAGAATVLPDRGAEPDRTGPAEPPLVHHDDFVSHSGPFDLLTARVGRPGQNTLDLEVPAHRGELHVEIACYGAGGRPGEYWVSGYVGDTMPDRPRSEWCGRDPDTPVVPGVRGDAPGPWNYDPGLTIEPGGGRGTVHVALTREVDENGVPIDHPDDTGTYVRASDPDAWLGIAVYTVADPVTEMAGLRIPPLVGLDGHDYAYASHRRTDPGARNLTWTLEPSTEERYYDVVAVKAMYATKYGADVGVRSSLDGDSCRISVALVTFRSGGCLLSPGEPHTITLTIGGDVPPDAVLGIVLYEKRT